MAEARPNVLSALAGLQQDGVRAKYRTLLQVARNADHLSVATTIQLISAIQTHHHEFNSKQAYRTVVALLGKFVSSTSPQVVAQVLSAFEYLASDEVWKLRAPSTEESVDSCLVSLFPSLPSYSFTHCIGQFVFDTQSKKSTGTMLGKRGVHVSTRCC